MPTPAASTCSSAMLSTPLLLAALLCADARVITFPMKKTENATIDLHERAALRRREAGVQDVNLVNRYGWYSVEMAFGTPKQTTINTFVDTGSADTWVGFNAYNTSDSSTFYNRSQTVQTCYGDGTCSNGFMANDTIWINGDIEVPNCIFAIDPTSTNQLIGLSWTDYDNFPITMKTQGLTETSFYAMWMNGFENGDGTITFGGIDQSRFVGSIGIVQNLDTPSFDGDGNAVYPERPTKNTTPLNGIRVKNNIDKVVQDAVTDLSVPVWFDSGYTTAHMPRSWLEAIGAAFGCAWDEDFNGEMCGYEPDGSVIFDFSGVEIEISVKYLIDWWKTTNNDGRRTQGFLFLPDDSEPAIDHSYFFGNQFMRMTYIAFDMENRQFGIAQALGGSDSEVVSSMLGDEAIVEVTSTIPGAYTGSNYGTTYHTRSTIHTPTNPGTYTYTAPTSR